VGTAVLSIGNKLDKAADVASVGLKTAEKGFGLVGAVLGTVDAAIDMAKQGPTWSNVAQMTFGLASGVLLLTPLGEAYQTFTTVVGGCAVVNDVISIATKK
jgi:hypothetical protein